MLSDHTKLVSVKAIRAIYANDVSTLKEELKNGKFDFTDYYFSAFLSCNSDVLNFFEKHKDFNKQLSRFTEDQLATIYIESVICRDSKIVKELINTEIRLRNTDAYIFEKTLSRFWMGGFKDNDKEIIEKVKEHGFDILRVSDNGQSIQQTLIKFAQYKLLEIAEELSETTLNFEKEEYTNSLFNPIKQFLEVHTKAEEQDARDFIDALIMRDLPLTDIIIESIKKVKSQKNISSEQVSFFNYLKLMHENYHLKKIIQVDDFKHKKRL